MVKREEGESSSRMWWSTLNGFDIEPKRKAFIYDQMCEMCEVDEKTYQHSVELAFMMYDHSFEYNIDKNEAFITGLLHDVGKLDINRNVLLKDDTYNEEDKAEMRKHPRYSHKRLKNFFPVLAEAALRHHTNQGRNSYPKDLADLTNTDKAAPYVKALCRFDYEEARSNHNDGWKNPSDNVVSRKKYRTPACEYI